jgi:regulator of sigma E protease
VPVVVRRREGPREVERTFDLRLERQASRDGWFLGVSYGVDRVKSVEAGSPAARAGIAPGDTITRVKTQRTLGIFWRDAHDLDGHWLAPLLLAQEDKGLQVTWEARTGETKRAVVAARPSAAKIGILPGVERAHRRVFIRRGVAGACVLGVKRTIRNTEQLLLTLRALVTRRVSARELGGPLKIAEVTYRHAQLGFGKLLYILALLSVNLAVLNVLPIPVLDGGHLFLLAVEKLKGKPLSENVLAYTQWVGLLLILGLMVAVTFNDIRSWFE